MQQTQKIPQSVFTTHDLDFAQCHSTSSETKPYSYKLIYTCHKEHISNAHFKTVK